MTPAARSPAAFAFDNPDYGGLHSHGDVRCRSCTLDFPHLCAEPGCHGLMHAHTAIERGGSSVLRSECDVCGRHMPHA